jgi:hypothetical protein
MTAAILETRLLPNLPDVVINHAQYLPVESPFYFFTTREGYDYYSKKLSGVEFREIPPIRTLNDYNKLLTSQEFWAMLPVDKCLIFQHDSMILREGIEEFFEFDMVGAPWKFQYHGNNGGFSLRDPLIMQHICKDFKWHPGLGYEDVFFCNIMHQHDIGELAPREVCRKFACETIFELGTLGVHAIQKYLTPQQVNQIMTQYDNQ